CAKCRTHDRPRSSLRRPTAERQTADVRPLPNAPSTASTPPPKGERCYPCVRYDLSPMPRAAHRLFTKLKGCRRAPRAFPADFGQTVAGKLQLTESGLCFGVECWVARRSR